jgi:Cu2+-exporting ATPase
LAWAWGNFCHSGCEAVYGLLQTEDLDAYYRLRGSRGVPVADRHAERRDAKWIDAIEARVKAESAHARVTLDVKGLHCVACIWPIEERSLSYATGFRASFRFECASRA